MGNKLSPSIGRLESCEPQIGTSAMHAVRSHIFLDFKAVTQNHGHCTFIGLIKSIQLNLVTNSKIRRLA